jgi:hypothetical protein
MVRYGINWAFTFPVALIMTRHEGGFLGWCGAILWAAAFAASVCLIGYPRMTAYDQVIVLTHPFIGVPAAGVLFIVGCALGLIRDTD